MLPLSRRNLLFALLGAPVAKALSAQNLSVRLDGDFVRVSAPHLAFLSGKTLERLQDGASIYLIGQVSVSVDGNATVQSRSVARFALSFDIWEEKFSVTLIQQTRRTVSHLSKDAAQNWVIDSLTLNTGLLPPDRPFWLRLELRAEDPAEDPNGALEIIGGSGINLTRLVEIFSRPPGAAQQRWSADAGPLRLADLRPGPRAMRKE